MIRSILVFVIALAATAAFAQTYKWRDPDGRIQYSDTPPPANARDVQQLRKPPPAPTTGAAPAAKSYADRDADFRKRLAERQEAEAKQAQAAENERIRARNCEQARGQLAALDSGSRVVRFTEQGERIALDDKERELARLDALKAIEDWCKPAN